MSGVGAALVVLFTVVGIGRPESLPLEITQGNNPGAFTRRVVGENDQRLIFSVQNKNPNRQLCCVMT